MQAFSFDTRTIVIILMGVTVVLGVTMNLIRLTRKTYPGFGLWTAGTTTYTFGFLFLALRNIISDIFSIVLAGVFILSAALCFWEGTRRFRGKEVRKTLIVLLIAGYAVFQSYFTFVNNDIGVRIITYSLLAAVIYCAIALELFQVRLPALRASSWFTGSLFALYGIFMVFRGLLTELLPPLHDLLEPNMLQAMTFLLGIFFGIAWTFGFVMLNSERLEADLKGAQDKLQKMATTDFLTGIANSRLFSETGEREVQRADRYKRPLALLMIDLDHFKKVNDKYGHAIGDKILVAFAGICKKCLRKADIFGRLGGEEFAILLPETDINGGSKFAERLRAIVEKSKIKVESKPFHITVSIGVTELQPDDDQIDAALRRADDTMYEAKKRGRNQVAISQ
ncbi:MAG: GGDEF domain-containing protein [Deltaproteobacteria bacterium]|nr:GGDEF domain-containing protein [Deltaproteobacteria bacterium]